jgi:hypothetical protein
MKHNTTCIIGILEGKEGEQETENLFKEIMTEKFPNLVKENDTQVQEAWRAPIKMIPETHT